MKGSKSEAVVDRIEGDLAVVETEWREMVNIPLQYLPKGTREGNVIDITFRLNPEKENKKRKDIIKLQQELLRRSKQ
jgi:hypothetical protein